MESLPVLLSRQAELQRRIAAARTEAREAALVQIRELMKAHSLSASDVLVASTKVKGPLSGAKVAPKYRHPETGASWSGRGLKPKWLTEEMMKGRALADFRI